MALSGALTRSPGTRSTEVRERCGDRIRRFRASLVGLILMLACAAAFAAGPTPVYEVKAAFLLNFTKFTEWPPSAFASGSSPISVCIMGKDPFGRFIDDIVRGETVNDRRIIVSRISDGAAAKNCHVVYVGDDAESEQIVHSLPHPVLTIGEGEKFIQEGGMITFVIDDRRVRFLVNPGAAQAAGLRLSSRLLNVAKAIEGPKP
jgi:hypothetical protein